MISDQGHGEDDAVPAEAVSAAAAAAAADAAGRADAAVQAEAAPASRRPSPGPAQPAPSPSFRARRAAAAAVDRPVRRPSPKPGPGANPEQAQPPTVAGPAAGSLAVADRADQADVGPDGVGPDGIVTEDTATAAPGTQASASSMASGRGPLWLGAVLTALIVVLAAASWWLATATHESGSVTARERALSAAKSSVPVILSYDYRQFAKDAAAGKARLTGRASTDYTQAMTKTIQPAATKAHVAVQAQTDGAGVESVSASGKQVTVIVFGEQKVTNISLTAPRTDIFRVRATLDLVGKQWLVSKFDQI